MKLIDVNTAIKEICKQKCGEHFNRCNHPCLVIKILDNQTIIKEIKEITK